MSEREILDIFIISETEYVEQTMVEYSDFIISYDFPHFFSKIYSYYLRFSSIISFFLFTIFLPFGTPSATAGVEDAVLKENAIVKGAAQTTDTAAAGVLLGRS